MSRARPRRAARRGTLVPLSAAASLPARRATHVAGVHDRTADVAAESTLHRNGDWKVRPTGFLARDNVQRMSIGGPDDQELPYNVQPWYEWRDLTLDASEESFLNQQ